MFVTQWFNQLITKLQEYINQANEHAIRSKRGIEHGKIVAEHIVTARKAVNPFGAEFQSHFIRIEPSEFQWEKFREVPLPILQGIYQHVLYNKKRSYVFDWLFRRVRLLPLRVFEHNRLKNQP